MDNSLYSESANINLNRNPIDNLNPFFIPFNENWIKKINKWEYQSPEGVGFYWTDGIHSLPRDYNQWGEGKFRITTSKEAQKAWEENFRNRVRAGGGGEKSKRKSTKKSKKLSRKRSKKSKRKSTRKSKRSTRIKNKRR